MTSDEIKIKLKTEWENMKLDSETIAVIRMDNEERIEALEKEVSELKQNQKFWVFVFILFQVFIIYALIELSK